MFPIDVFRPTLDKLVSILNRYGIRFHITGGVTSIAYGEPRMTQDVDIVVDNALVEAAMEGVLESLATSDFLHSPDDVRKAVANRDMFQLLDSDEMLKLDVYTREMIPGELSRSQQGELFEGVFLPIASRADTVLAKLVWVSKGSHKSRRDLRYLYRNTDQQQRTFIADMAQDFGLTSLLAEVLAEPDELPP